MSRLSKEEIENMKIGLWNIRAENLRAMQCSLADTSDKKEWQKEINTIDNALKYIDQLESDKQNLIEKLEGANKLDKQIVQNYENMYRNATEEFYKRSYKRTIDMANASRETRKGVLSILKGENHEKYANKSKWR